MCIACHGFALPRRSFLALAASGAAAVAVAPPGGRALAADAKTTVTADEALARLKSGNDRFVSAPQLCATDLAKQRDGIAKAQTPWASIVGCADSRTPPELVFGGVGLGELFVARNAGNMADTATMGTIEYGAAELGIPLILVLGHQRCGAVDAACAVVKKHAEFPGSIGPMVAAIVPAARAVQGKPGDFVENAVRESAKRTAAKIAKDSRIVSSLVKANKVKVLAAYYDLDNGKVEYLT